LEIASAFCRDARQIEISRAKFDSGVPIDTALISSAPHGYREHHTGCAVDIHMSGCDPVEGVSKETDAFRWLLANAGRFGFTLSYPRNNPWGYVYEPWHWCYRPVAMGPQDS
jgi:D-alanyl-D-alanine carboxypeptidase